MLQVPSSALFRSQKGWAVFLVDGPTAKLRPVTIGMRGGFADEIVAGVSAGEIVINHPSDAVTDGGLIEYR